MDRNGIKKREQEILNALKLTNQLTIDDVVKLLGISESTARRIFISLEKEGLILRTYGGISLASANDNNYTYERLETSCVEEKIRIGIAAADFIENHDILFLDTGTTLPHMCMALTKRIEEGKLNSLKIFTTSLVNLNLLSKFTQVILIGGIYRPERRDFYGFITEEAFRDLHFNKCFLGTDGYDENGFTTTDFDTARLNRLALDHSKRKYILTDSSKYKKNAMVNYSKIEQINCIITNYCPDEMMNKFNENNTEVKIV